MKETLQRICQLQPSYSSENTEEMKERGNLIRTVLPNNLRLIESDYSNLLSRFDTEIGIEGSDGIGRKTEAPWTRIYSPLMSPSPREGYYVVIHFAADGSKVFFTVGCGSTVWNGGDLRPVSDEELATKTGWAKQAIIEKYGSIEPFSDIISLGAKAKLPRTFEKATIVAKAVPYEELSDDICHKLVIQAVSFLSAIYEAQRSGRDIDPGVEAEIEVAKISKPNRKYSRGQGMSLTAAERKAIEIQAMFVARQWLENEGFGVKDVSSNSSFDFEASQDNKLLKVEVKGTTSDICQSIMMTKNEVELHREEKGATALILVAGIRLDKSISPPMATGGRADVMMGWDIDDWIIEPIAYQIRKQS